MKLPEQDPENVPVVTPNEVAGEIASFTRAHQSRRRLFPRAALVGILSGLVGVVFRRALVLAEQARESLLGNLHSSGWLGFAAAVAVIVSGCAASEYLVKGFCPEAAGSGIPHLKGVLYALRTMRWKRIFPVKFFGGAIGIGSGLALGREGPTTQMGGAVGQLVSELLKTTPQERQTSIAAGAGAGLTAAFNAPISGMVFVLEELQRDFTPGIFVAALIASVLADVVTRLASGQVPVIPITIFPTPPLTACLPFLLLGVSAGVLGVAYNRGLMVSLNFFQRLNQWPPGARGALVGLVIAPVAWFWPEVVGGGYHLVDDMFLTSMPLRLLGVLWIIRYALTVISYGCGAPGGIFAPLLVLGALNGLAAGQVTDMIFPHLGVPPQVYAVVGMGAYFTAIVRAPLTGIVLIVEMTSNYNLTLPLLIAGLSAYAVAEAMKDRPIYEALLERDLTMSRPEGNGVHDTLLLEITVQPGSPFEGKMIKELGLPQGCIVVTIGRNLLTMVPHADTVLKAGDRLTTVVEPEASEGVYLLRSGTLAQ